MCGRNPIPLVNGQPPDALKDIWATLTPVQQATLAALPQLPAPNSLVDFSYAANKREVKSPLGTKYTYYRRARLLGAEAPQPLSCPLQLRPVPQAGSRLRHKNILPPRLLPDLPNLLFASHMQV